MKGRVDLSNNSMEILTPELETKKRLLQTSIQILSRQMKAAKDAMDEAQESANEHQGAMEDKFESFRENCQIQRDMYARQLDELISTMALLRRINVTKMNSEIALGAVVHTSLQNYFIGVSLGEIKVDDETYFAISAMSPIGKLLTGKKAGESFNFRDKEYKILQVT